MGQDNAADERERLREMVARPDTFKAFCNGRPILSDWEDVIAAMIWLKVFAAPRIFGGLRRMPPREHILRMVDMYIAYVDHDGRYIEAEFEPVPYERRKPLSARFRALIEQWSPPGLPREMIEVARELLHAEGSQPPPEGWDNYAGDPGDPPPEDCLLWPEASLPC